MPQLLTSTFYKFVPLNDPAALRAELLHECEAHALKGTILLAHEGINGTIAGAAPGVRALVDWLRADSRLADLEPKYSLAEVAPFRRMKVRLKREIVTLGQPGLDPVAAAGSYVAPEHWNALIAQPDVVLIDVRNAYEVAIGSFDGAVDPRTTAFSDLPQWIDRQRVAGGLLSGQPKVAMFCTGGIRCEKSTAYLRSQGVQQVYHLEGGILKYLEVVPEAQSRWRGECFVFDERVALGHGLEPGESVLCRGCRRPVTPQERGLPQWRDGVSCANCRDRTSAEQKRRFADRQRQLAPEHLRNLAGAAPKA